MIIENLDYEWRMFLKDFYEKANLSKDLKWEFKYFLLEKLKDVPNYEDKIADLEYDNKELTDEKDRLEAEIQGLEEELDSYRNNY